MIYTLPHDPDVLQAYCKADRELPRRPFPAATKDGAPRQGWLQRLRARRQEARAKAQAEARESFTEVADPEEAVLKAKTDALVQAARWGC
ncbi:MAG: hypothetical protein AAF495_26070 [Pseudomonadota bacterium]